VLNPGDAPFDRSDIEASAEPTDRLAFPGASTVSALPFSSVSFDTDSATYTTPELLKTIMAVDVSAMATPTGVEESGETGSSEPTTVPDSGSSKVVATSAMIAALAVAVCMM
jgi:hypothetical protein